MNKWNLFKTSIKLPTLKILHMLLLFSLWGENPEIIRFFKNHSPDQNFSYIGSYDKWVRIKSWEKLANFLLCKAPSKENFLEDVESRVELYYTYKYLDEDSNADDTHD